MFSSYKPMGVRLQGEGLKKGIVDDGRKEGLTLAHAPVYSRLA